jgi:CubicO group peptidase (beta-lactamase class C family)
MQLYLNGGNFNGYKYLDSKTLKRFVACYSCETGNRRGLGFDRPQKEGDGPTCGCVSDNSFGHTGFTGTFAWADPESGIILVFLSNRIFPNAENKNIYELDIRTRIQQVIQDSIL